MKILCHHIYEYKKGLRNLVLHTFPAELQCIAEERLRRNNISYIIRKVSKNKINAFFDANECVEIIESFGDKSLSEFSHEEDFILGIMLGYSRLEQCRRYIKRKQGCYNMDISKKIEQDMNNYNEGLVAFKVDAQKF